MIFDLTNNEGYVYAYIVFQVVDKDSKLSKEGEYLFINGFWVHENHRGQTKEILAHFIRKLFNHEETKNLAWVYWERDKNGKIIRFPAWKFVKRFLKIDTNIGE